MSEWQWVDIEVALPFIMMSGLPNWAALRDCAIDRCWKVRLPDHAT